MVRFLKILCVIAAFFLLAGAPAYASGHGGEAKSEGKGEGKGEEGGKKKEGPEGVTGGRFAGDPVYVHLPPIILPVISDAGAEQMVTMMVDLQAKDFEKATDMHTNMPRLKDALLKALYVGMSEGDFKNGSILDLDKIKESIKNRTNKVFGEDSVVEVLIQAIQQRRY